MRPVVQPIVQGIKLHLLLSGFTIAFGCGITTVRHSLSTENEKTLKENLLTRMKDSVEASLIFGSPIMYFSLENGLKRKAFGSTWLATAAMYAVYKFCFETSPIVKSEK